MTNIKLFLPLMFFSMSAFSVDIGKFLPEIESFIEKRDLCDHFRGEDPYDEERREFLRQNIGEFCTGTDQVLKDLIVKYSSNNLVIKKLSGYEVDIEANKQRYHAEHGSEVRILLLSQNTTTKKAQPHDSSQHWAFYFSFKKTSSV